MLFIGYKVQYWPKKTPAVARRYNHKGFKQKKAPAAARRYNHKSFSKKKLVFYYLLWSEATFCWGGAGGRSPPAKRCIKSQLVLLCLNRFFLQIKHSTRNTPWLFFLAPLPHNTPPEKYVRLNLLYGVFSFVRA